MELLYSELAGVSGIALHLAIVVLPVVHVMRSAYWEQTAKTGWVVSILVFNLFAYGVFLFATSNRVNRREMDLAAAPAQAGAGRSAGEAPAGRLSVVFVIGRWVSILGRVAAIAIAIGILVWALPHLSQQSWKHHGWWPLYYLFLFLYWLPVEIAGQILMALGRRRRPAGKSGT